MKGYKEDFFRVTFVLLYLIDSISVGKGIYILRLDGGLTSQF